MDDAIKKLQKLPIATTALRPSILLTEFSADSSDQIGTDQVSSVGYSPGTVMSLLQPTPMIPLAHGKGRTTSLSSTVVVTITETPASEAPDVSAPIVNVVFHSGCNLST